MIAALALALVTQAVPSPVGLAAVRPYAAEFALGVAAHLAGDADAAATHFRAAGKLAPGAPLWPLYLALTRGEAPSPPTLERDAGGPWQLVDVVSMYRPRFAPGGACFATGASGRISLWDATGGALVALITAPEWQPIAWSFETSGRYLLGARYGRGQSDVLSELEVRLRASGALASPTLPIGRWVAREVSASWTNAPFQAAHRSEDGPWFAVRRFPLEGGTLTVHLPEPRGTGGGTNVLELRTDGRRALVRSNSTGIGGKGRCLTWLIDPSDAEPVARQLGNSWGRFSAGGALVLPSFLDDDLWVLDADSDKALTAPDAVATTGDPRSDAIITFAAHGGTLRVASRDRVGTWDPRSAAWTAMLRLDPPLDSLDLASQDRLDLSVLERSRVLLFSGDSVVAAYDADAGVRLWERPDEASARFAHPLLHDAERGFVLVEWPSGEVRLVDARTGDIVLTPRRGATEARRVTSFAVAPETALTLSATGEPVAAAPPRECALVAAAADSTLRTFAFATGASLGRSSVHAGREVLGFAIDDARVAREVYTWDAEGRVARLALPGLEERARLDVGADESVRAVAAQHGVAAVLHAPKDDQHIAELLRIDDGVSVASFTLDAPPRFALSDDGARVAVVAGPRTLVVSTATGATLHDLSLGAPPLGEYAGAVTFHGAAHFVLGFGTDTFLDGVTGVGVSVAELATGAIVAHHRARGLGVDSFGGWVGDIESMQELGRLAYSVNPSWLVYLLGDAGFVEVAEHVYQGGNAAPLDLKHVVGTDRQGLQEVHLQPVGEVRGRVSFDRIAVPGLRERADERATGDGDAGHGVVVQHARVRVHRRRRERPQRRRDVRVRVVRRVVQDHDPRRVAVRQVAAGGRCTRS